VFVEADGGTLFLDEIGDMPMAVQARLLRVLQEAEVRPVGASGVRSVDVRMIAATHADLTVAVEHGRFREDLYYRLKVVVLSVPALRERYEDLPMLAAHFLKKHGGGSPPSLSPDALDALMSYAWPGNVRELESAIMHTVALHRGEVVMPEALPAAIVARGTGRASAWGTMSGSVAVLGDDGQLPRLTEAKRRASAVFEKHYLTLAMERARGSISEAARLAGLDRTNFRRLLQRHGIDATEFKS
jgi:two-component system response regulator HydG